MAAKIPWRLREINPGASGYEWEKGDDAGLNTGTPAGPPRFLEISGDESVCLIRCPQSSGYAEREEAQQKRA